MVHVDELSSLQHENLTNIHLTFSTISLVCSLIIVVCHFVFKSERTFASKLIFWVSLADIGFGVGAFFTNPHDATRGPICYVQAYFTQFSQVASMLYTTVIGFTMHQIYLRDKPPTEFTDYLERRGRVHWVCLGVSVLLTILPQTTDSYGQASGVCWIQSGSVGTVWQFVAFFIPLWSCQCYLGYVYWHVWHSLKAMSGLPIEEDAKKKRNNIMNSVRYYPSVLFIMYFFSTINRLYLSAHPHAPNYGLTAVDILFSSCQGLLNFMVYGFATSVMTDPRTMLQRMWGACRDKCDGHDAKENDEVLSSLHDVELQANNSGQESSDSENGQKDRSPLDRSPSHSISTDDELRKQP